MRKRFDAQLKLGQIPIEEVRIPVKSRDELPPVLRTLQWIYATPEISEKIFRVLEEQVKGTKKETGRMGMYLWHILVLGIVRLALDCDYDRLEYLVHYDKLMRQVMGLENHFEGEFGAGFHQKTIQENISYIDSETIKKINAIVVMAGRELLKKNQQKKLKRKQTHTF